MAVDLDAAAHQFAQALADDQAQTAAAIAPRDRFIGLREGQEQRADALGGDADAGVPHHELHPDAARVAVVAEGPPPHAQEDLPRRGELDRIAQQVVEDLAQSGGVPHQHAGQRLVDVDHELQALLVGGQRKQVRAGLDQRLQLEFLRVQFHLPGLDLREVEDAVEDTHQGHRRLVDPPHVIGRPARHVGQVQAQRRQPDHRVHGGADLVAHPGQEIGLGHVRLDGDARGLPERLIAGDLLGHVDVDADHAKRLAMRIVGRVGAGLDVMDGAVARPVHAEQAFVLALAPQRPPDGLLCGSPVIGMHAVGPGLIGAAEGSLLQAVELIHHLVPDQQVLWHIPVPDPHDAGR